MVFGLNCIVILSIYSTHFPGKLSVLSYNCDGKTGLLNEYFCRSNFFWGRETITMCTYYNIYQVDKTFDFKKFKNLSVFVRIYLYTFSNTNNTFCIITFAILSSQTFSFLTPNVHTIIRCYQC